MTSLTLLALADLHGAAGMGARIAVEAAGFDAVVLAGDLTRFFTPSQTAAVLEPFLRTGRPLFAVAGNCDGTGVHKLLEDLGCSLAGRGAIPGGRRFLRRALRASAPRPDLGTG